MTDLVRHGSVPFEQLLEANQTFAQLVYHTGVTDLLPKDENVKIQAFLGGLAPGGMTEYHVHNGTGIFLVLEGACRVERRDTGESLTYGVGELFYEPIGKIHRGVNASDTLPYTAFGIKITAPYLEHDTYMEAMDHNPNRSFGK